MSVLCLTSSLSWAALAGYAASERYGSCVSGVCYTVSSYSFATTKSTTETFTPKHLLVDNYDSKINEPRDFDLFNSTYIHVCVSS